VVFCRPWWLNFHHGPAAGVAVGPVSGGGPMLVSLSRSYTCRGGAPVVSQVDTEIFTLTYFMHCMECTTCHDSCCQYGADTELPMKEAILAEADRLEPVVGVPRSEWFHDYLEDEPEYPGGKYTRTRVRNGRCVFLNRAGRGCLLHRDSLERGVDFRELKPLVCCLFPVSFSNGVFHPGLEVSDGSLACLGPGPTVYRAARNDILYYFGDEVVAELDTLEVRVTPPPMATPVNGGLALTVVSAPG
jgi:Fe-S-cluster containining protein